MATFSLFDCAIFSLSILLSLLIGIYFGVANGGQRSTSALLLGERRMPVLPTALSLLVSFQSGILILGISSEIYLKGADFIFHGIGVVVALPIAAWIYLPIFYKLQLTSVYEYLELRYKSALVRQIGSLLFVLTTLVYMSIAIFAPAVALSAVSGLQLELLIAVTGLICTFYTAVGGLKAVVWTDAFQAIIMLIGFVMIIVEGVSKVGGFRKVWSIASDGGRLHINTDPNPFVYMSMWTVLLGTTFGWMSIYGTNQTAVQRYTSLSSLRKARLSLLLVIPGVLLMLPMVCFTGILIYSYYAHCDPLRLKLITDRDQLLPYFTVEVLSDLPGLPGIFLACLYSATMSTLSSGLNSISAVVWTDFIRHRIDPKTSDRQGTRITMLIAMFFGIFAIVLALFARHFGGVLQAAMTLINLFGGPLSGMFLFGMLFPWANKPGVIAGVVSSFAILIWICAGAQIVKPYRQHLDQSVSGCFNDTMFAGATANAALIADAMANFTRQFASNVTTVASINPQLFGLQYVYKLSYKLYGFVGVLIVFIVGAPVSLATGQFEIAADQSPYIWSEIGRFCAFVRWTKKQLSMLRRRRIMRDEAGSATTTKLI